MHNAPAASIGNALMVFTNHMLVARHRNACYAAAVQRDRQVASQNAKIRALSAALARAQAQNDEAVIRAGVSRILGRLS